MKVLAFETTSERGSAAIVEGADSRAARVLGYASHEDPSQQAERLLGMVEEVLLQAGIGLKSVDRVAAGVGPGSFTGARIGVAQAQGLALGLGIPGLGVGSLRIIAAGLPQEDPRVRVVVRDARREEFFYAAYRASGEEFISPQTISQRNAIARIEVDLSCEQYVILGEPLLGLPHFRDDTTRAPDARALGRLALELAEEGHPLIPQYLRGPVVVRPNLPVSPLASPRDPGGSVA